MSSLILYGQIRTFQICIPNILQFIKFNSNKYDVYLCIDKNNDIHYTEKNMNVLKKMFGDNIKKIWFIEEHIDKIKEKQLVDTYFHKCDMIKKFLQQNVFGFKNNTNININSFVSKLYYRRFITLQLVHNYMLEHNLVYDKCIFTRFDINILNVCNDIITDTNPEKLYIKFDTIFIGTIIKLLNIFQFYKNYFSIFDYIIKNGSSTFTEQYIQEWICMPEENLKYFLKHNNTEYTEIKNSIILQR